MSRCISTFMNIELNKYKYYLDKTLGGYEKGS